MATKYIERATDFPGSVNDNGANVAPVFIDSDLEQLRMYNQTASVWTAAGDSAVTKTASFTAEQSGKYLLNAAAGLTVTLPAAVGSGATIRIFVGTTITSNSLIINAAGTDKFYGGVFLDDTGLSGVATVDRWPASAGVSVTFTLAQALGLGVVGDHVEITDVASGKWVFEGVITGGVDLTSGGSMWS